MSDAAQQFQRMADLVPPGRLGEAEVVHHTITPLEAAMSTMRGIYTVPETVAVLRVGGQVVMSDTEHEHRTNRELLRQAHGAVLLGGLGLGLVVHPLRANPKVTSITVVEESADVIALIGTTLPAGVNVVHGDVFTWTPPAGMKYDTIYFDIWPTITGDHWEEMKELTARARSWRRRGAWVSCWTKATTRRLARV